MPRVAKHTVLAPGASVSTAVRETLRGVYPERSRRAQGDIIWDFEKSMLCPRVVEKTGPLYQLLEFIIHKTALARDHNGFPPTVDL